MLVLRFLDRHSIPFFGAPKIQSLIGLKGVLKVKNMFFDFAWSINSKVNPTGDKKKKKKSNNKKKGKASFRRHNRRAPAAPSEVPADPKDAPASLPETAARLI